MDLKTKAIISQTPHVFHAKCTIWLPTIVTIKFLSGYAFYLVPAVIALLLNFFKGVVKLLNLDFFKNNVKSRSLIFKTP
jgi:hypothetical protein